MLHYEAMIPARLVLDGAPDGVIVPFLFNEML